jgi:hypothetical protein
VLSPLAFTALAVVIAILLSSFAIFMRRRLSPEAQILAFSSRFSVGDAAKKFEVSEKTVRRLRVLAGLEAKTCATCDHFDIPKGQEAIRNDGNIARVTQALTPGAISRDPTNGQSWSEFGACHKRVGLVLGSSDWCGKFKVPDEQGDTWA